jgi:hypothetical protein
MVEVNGGNLESILNIRTAPGAGAGYIKEFVPNQVFLNNNGTLAALGATGAGVVGLGAVGATLTGIGWVFNATADQTKKLIFKGKLPRDFRLNVERNGDRCALLARAKVRKVDTTGSATDNTDLRLSCRILWHNDGIVTTAQGAATEGNGETAFNAVTVSSTTLNLLPAMVAVGAEESTRWMEWDLGSAMSAAQRNALKPGADYLIEFFPHEAIGTDLAVEMWAVEFLYRGHLIAQDLFWKNKVLL